MIRRLAAILALATVLAAVLCLMTDTARTADASVTPGNVALSWAEAHAAGCWYSYGGTACSPGYDCSGLVQVSFEHAGVWLPRTTSGMVHSWHLYRVWNPRRGDLAFWGPIGAPTHTEFVTIWYRQTFGAHHTGTRVGWRAYGPGYMPSAFYRVR